MFNHDDSCFDEEENIITERDEYLQKEASFTNQNNTNPQYDEFSFKLNHSIEAYQRPLTQYQSPNSTLTLRQNLQHLDKSEIIDLLLEEIKSGDSYNEKEKSMTLLVSDRPLCEQTFGYGHKRKIDLGQDNRQMKYKIQYEELVKDFEEYIGNTNQAQKHYLKAIQDLKKENNQLQQNLSHKAKQTTNQSPYSQLIQIQNHTLVQKLQETVQKYIEINNQLISKVEKLERGKKQADQEMKKLKDIACQLQNECEELQKENEKFMKENSVFREVIEEMKGCIMEKRQSREIQGNGSQRDSFEGLRDKKGFVNGKQEVSKNQNDSLLNGSQIKRTQQSINESLLMFTHSNQSKNKTSTIHPPLNQSVSSKFNSVASYEQQFNPNAFHLLQIHNKELKLTNMKLQGLLQRKSEKIRKLFEQIQIMGEEKVRLKQEVNRLSFMRKSRQDQEENTEVKLHEKVFDMNHVSHHANQTIGGAKMTSSSIYSLKNCHSTSLDASKVSKPLEENLQKTAFIQQKASAIKQAYQNCFKKTESKSTQESTTKQKNDNIKFNEEAYMPKALFQSNKKNSQTEGSISGSQLSSGRTEGFGVIKKRSTINSKLNQFQEIDMMNESKFSTGRNSAPFKQQND